MTKEAIKEAERQRLVEMIFERSRQAPWARAAHYELEGRRLVERVSAFLGGEAGATGTTSRRALNVRKRRGTHRGPRGHIKINESTNESKGAKDAN